MNEEVLITGFAGIITTITGSFTSWIFARKKYNAEVDSTKIDNLSKIIDVQNEQIRNLQDRLDASLERNKQLEKELIDVRTRVSNLMILLIEHHIIPDEKKDSEEPA